MIIFCHTGSVTFPQRAMRGTFAGHCLVTVAADFKIRRSNIVLESFSSLADLMAAACTAHLFALMLE